MFVNYPAEDGGNERPSSVNLHGEFPRDSPAVEFPPRVAGMRVVLPQGVHTRLVMQDFPGQTETSMNQDSRQKTFL